jgi:divalent metal cation (Fe/Co/Zn/Cd) transporter
MVRSAIILLMIAAMGGLVMAGLHFTGQPLPPAPLAVLHGMVSAGAVAMLLYTCFTVGLPRMVWSGFGALVLAAAGGLLLHLGYRRKRQRLPPVFILLHASVALVGLVMLSVAGWKLS